MKFAVLKFPGSNCDRDMYNAALKTGVEAATARTTTPPPRRRETSSDGYDSSRSISLASDTGRNRAAPSRRNRSTRIWIPRDAKLSGTPMPS